MDRLTKIYTRYNNIIQNNGHYNSLESDVDGDMDCSLISISATIRLEIFLSLTEVSINFLQFEQSNVHIFGCELRRPRRYEPKLKLNISPLTLLLRVSIEL